MDGSLNIEGSLMQDEAASSYSPSVNYFASTPVGVAIFDADGLSDSGWACIHGTPPFRVKSPFLNLSTDTIWWTNLSPERLKGRTPQTVRSNNYLKVTIAQAAAELGLQGMGPNELVQRMAFHFKVLCRLVEHISDKPFAFWARNRSFHQDMHGVAGASPILPKAHADAFLGQGNKWFFTSIEDVKASDTVLFRKPRLSYALDLLHQNVPAKPITWKQKQAPDPMAIIRKTMAPVYAEYSIQSAHPTVAQIFGLAQQDGKLASPARILAAHPELIALDAFCKLKVKDYWKGDEQYEYLPAADTLPPKIIEELSGRYAQFSWSMGILAQALLVGMTSPFMLSGKQGNMTWRGAWLRAADKVNMFQAALAFKDHGYRPASYGHGWIRVVRPETSLANDGLLLVAMQLGLLPDPGEMDPATIEKVSTNVYGPAKPKDGWKNGAFAAHLFQHNKFKLAQLTDDMPLLSGQKLQKREDALRKLL